jgi:hypothetical protein
MLLISNKQGGGGMAQANPYPLRVERTIFEKFKVVARENGRSVNKELEMMIKMAITQYESQHGVIEIPNPAEQAE